MRTTITCSITLLAALGCGSERTTRGPAPTSPEPARTATGDLGAAGQALPEDATEVTTRAFRPKEAEPTPERIQRLRVPEGFLISVFARDLENPRMMAVAEDGTIYVTQKNEGNVVALRDEDGDGTADTKTIVARDLPDVHGITIHQGRLYLAQPKTVLVAELRGGQLGELRPLITDLPDGGQHPNRTMAFGPDGMLYVSVGSSCNACDESNPEHATLIQADPRGTDRRVFARGLRNTIGFAWHPQTRQLWGMDHGSDHRGDDIPPEELNLIEEGRDYGWPYAYGKREPDPIMDDPEDMSTRDYAAKTEPARLLYTAHSAPMAMVFYDGTQFPDRFRGDAFVAMRGSWNRVPAAGYKVVRIRFDQGNPVEIEDFMTGFLLPDGQSHFGRPTGLAVTNDGSLLVADDTKGVIYRISYQRMARR